MKRADHPEDWPTMTKRTIVVRGHIIDRNEIAKALHEAGTFEERLYDAATVLFGPERDLGSRRVRMTELTESECERSVAFEVCGP